MNSVFQYPPETSSAKPMELSPVKGKKVIADFDGGQISSDAGSPHIGRRFIAQIGRH